MPIYEYKCKKCDKIIESIQRFNDKPLTKCDCGGRLSKLMSKNSFLLQGTGWYKDGYQNKIKANKSNTDQSVINTSKGRKQDEKAT